MATNLREFYATLLKEEVWPLSIVPFIATGNLPIPDLTIEEMMERFPIEMELRKQAIDAYLACQLQAKQLGSDIYVTPTHFLNWLQVKNWDFPPQLIDETLKQINLKLKTKDKIWHQHKEKVQHLASSIVKRLGYFNQEHIYHDAEMQALLRTLANDHKKVPYSKTHIKKWIAEIDPRPISKRRGRFVEKSLNCETKPIATPNN